MNFPQGKGCFVKAAWILAAVLLITTAIVLTGCAHQQYGNINTGSVVYDAKYAYDAGITQEQALFCKDVGWKISADWAGKSTNAGQLDITRGGMAYENCVDCFKNKQSEDKCRKVSFQR